MFDAEELVYEISSNQMLILQNLKISSNFRISEKRRDSLYVIVIGLKSQHNHRIIVDTVDKYLSIKK